MIAQSQLIAGDRRRSQEIEHGSTFCDHDRRNMFPYDRRRSQTLLRSAIRDHMETSLYVLSSAIVCDRDRRIADDRRSMFPYDRRRSQTLLRSAICDPRSYRNQPLGSLSNDEGNGDENVTRKNIFIHLCFFAIISTRSTFTKMANYPGTKLEGMAYKLRKKMKIHRRAFTFSTKP